MRGLGRRGCDGGRRDGAGAQVVDRPLSLGAFAAYRGDVVNPATNFDWTDRTGNGHTLRQATALNKPTVVNPAEFGSKPAIRFDGATSYLAAIDAASNYAFLSDGISGCSVYAVLLSRQNSNSFQVILGTSDGGVTASGLGLVLGMYTNAPGALDIAIVGNGGGRAFNDQSSVGVAVNTAVVRSLQIKTGNTPVWANLKVTPPAYTKAGNTGSATLPAGTPAGTLTVGCTPLQGSFGQLDIAELVLFNRLVTPAEDTLMLSYFQSRYAFLV